MSIYNYKCEFHLAIKKKYTECTKIRDNELSGKLIKWPELIADYKEEEIINRIFFDNIILPFDIRHYTICSNDKNNRFDNFNNFMKETKNEFLNIVATKRRVLS